MKDNKYQLALNYLIDNVGMLQELVDKSKPMKIIYEADGYADGELCYDTAICQNCGRHFERYYDEHANYCPTCGQRLDWEDEEEVTE